MKFSFSLPTRPATVAFILGCLAAWPLYLVSPILGPIGMMTLGLPAVAGIAAAAATLFPLCFAISERLCDGNQYWFLILAIVAVSYGMTFLLIYAVYRSMKEYVAKKKS